jgi:predicted house-cleaning noncanonical NTP pyrophosphatase (MazG superfamily)
VELVRHNKEYKHVTDEKLLAEVRKFFTDKAPRREEVD